MESRPSFLFGIKQNFILGGSWSCFGFTTFAAKGESKPVSDHGDNCWNEKWFDLFKCSTPFCAVGKALSGPVSGGFIRH